MIIMKFGGSSVKDANMFKQVADIVSKEMKRKPIVVLSATKGTTDSLLKSIDEAINGKYDSFRLICDNHSKITSDLGLNNDLLKEEFDELKKALEVISKTKDKSNKMVDYISFFGERMSIKIFASYFNKLSIKSEAFVSGDIGLITNSNFGDAAILPDSYKKIDNFIKKTKSVPVITGFGGKDKEGEYTTFQRGGSDYVAALIGAAVNAEEIQIWTDVNGIMSCDPRVVPNAKTIQVLSFDEASELAYFGAKVLHPKTILPAIDKNIPVLVLNTYEPKHAGSTIVKEAKPQESVKAISYKKNITIIEVSSTRMLDAHGYLAKIFEVFEKYRKPVDMIATSEVDVSMTVDSDANIEEITKELKDIATVTIHKHKAIICVVGNGMKNNPGTAGKIFSTLGNHKINIQMISQCVGEISIGLVVDESEAGESIKFLHKELIR